MVQRRWWGAAVVGLLQVAVLGSIVVLGPADDAPHRAPVAVVAPPVLVTALSEQADRVEGRPLESRGASSAAAARAAVADGSVVAAVVVDLTVEQDTVYLASANGDDLNRSVRSLLEGIERSFGRDVVVQDVVPSRSGDDDARGVYVIVGLCVLLGFVSPIVITWVRGPVARTLRLGLVRLGIAAASATITGLLVALVAAARYDTGVGRWWLITALTLLASATITLALQSVFGVLGIGVATAVLVLSAAPMARLVSPWMLPEPWATIAPWLPPGAALDAARAEAYFGGSPYQPVEVLAAWSVLAVFVLGAARRERARDAIDNAGRVDS